MLNLNHVLPRFSLARLKQRSHHLVASESSPWPFWVRLGPIPYLAHTIIECLDQSRGVVGGWALVEGVFSHRIACDVLSAASEGLLVGHKVASPALSPHQVIHPHQPCLTNDLVLTWQKSVKSGMRLKDEVRII